jgi:hypothetical protein
MRRSRSFPRWLWRVAPGLGALLALATSGLWLGCDAARDDAERSCENCSAGSGNDAGGPVASSPSVVQPSPAPTVTSPDASAEPEPSNEPEPPLSVEPYGNCLASSEMCVAGAEPHCLVDSLDDPTMAFCSSACDSLGVCPLAPFGGTVTAMCLPVGRDRGACVLECLGGQECPGDMVCLPVGVCGYVTPDAIDPYGTCDDCPPDSVGCFNIAGGSVCVPPCAGGCPSSRSGTAVTQCFEAGEAIGCGLSCRDFRRCPDGMKCVEYGLTPLCVWPEANPCDNFDCGRNADCDVRDGEAVCECEPGFVEDEDGDCRGACELLSCHDSARCEIAQNGDAFCVCDEGQVMDQEGRCAAPVTGCPAAHTDGDPHEPNDCAAEAVQIAAGEAALGVSRVDATIGPLASDLDYWQVAGQGGTYWLLLESEEPLCGLVQTALPTGPAFGNFDFGVELRAGELPDFWLCGGDFEFDAESNADTSYSLGLLHFATFGDLPNQVDFAEQPLLSPDLFEHDEAVTVVVADSFDSAEDVDALSVRVRLPLVLSFTGQAAEIEMEVLDAMGEVAQRSTVRCGFSLEPKPCINFEGSEETTVNLSLRQSPEAEQTALRAWQLNW